MSTTSQAVASEALARMPSVPRRAASRELLYAIILIAALFAVLAAAVFEGMKSATLAGEQGADAVASEPLGVD
jgi:hypothetical protein